MIYLDLKYLHFVQHKLEGFTRKKDNVFNLRCPFCGDSQTNKNKKRGYIYAWKNSLRYTCHNCGITYSFFDFLKNLDQFVHDEYRIELFKEKYGTSFGDKTKTKLDTEPPKNTTKEKLERVKTVEEVFYSICKPLSELPNDNPAVKYCLDRKIPKFAFKRLYYIDDTKKLLKLKPDLDVRFSEQRLVLPFLDKNGNLLGLTCRALNPKSKLRYLTVKLTDATQVFGMDRVDPTKTIYVVEGPIDSLFLPNAIAVTGTSFGKVESLLKDLNIAPDQVILILDNQPRNKELVKIQSRLIDNGYNVVVWDIDDSYGKDINALIQDSGMSGPEVLQVIKRSITRGLEAKMKFMQWKKC